jgi:hypothetical protein
MMLKISNSQPVSYNRIRKRLMRAKLPIRINELSMLKDRATTLVERHIIRKDYSEVAKARIAEQAEELSKKDKQ